MSFRIRPQGTFTIPVDNNNNYLASFFNNTSAWPASRTATFTIYVPASASEFVCLNRSFETQSARIINPGDVKTYGPFDRETLSDMCLVSPNTLAPASISVLVSLDEVLSES